MPGSAWHPSRRELAATRRRRDVGEVSRQTGLDALINTTFESVFGRAGIRPRHSQIAAEGISSTCRAVTYLHSIVNCNADGVTWYDGDWSL